jgi:hypothetical protein
MNVINNFVDCVGIFAKYDHFVADLACIRLFAALQHAGNEG